MNALNPGFNVLIRDLTRDFERAQAKDALQFCSNWFQARLEEQRSRARDALSGRNSHSQSRRTSMFNVGIDQDDEAIGPLEVKRGSRGSITTAFTTIPAHASPPPSVTMFTNPFSPSSIPLTPGDFLHPPNSAIFARRTSVSAESIPIEELSSTPPLPFYPKTQAQLARIKSSIQGNFIFRDLDDEQESGVLNAMQEVRVEAGEEVIKQGDVGEYFYVVENGILDCYILGNTPPATPESPVSSSSSPPPVQIHPVYGRLVASCPPGTSFGELALMYGHPRAATVLSRTASLLWAVDRITFRTIILKAAHRRRTMYESFLSSVTLLAGLSGAERSKIADALVSKVYEDGEHVVRQGEMGDTFFFVEEGEAVVTKRVPRASSATPRPGDVDDDGMEEIQVGKLVKGDYFGELSLLRLAPRAATVSAVIRSKLTPTLNINITPSSPAVDTPPTSFRPSNSHSDIFTNPFAPPSLNGGNAPQPKLKVAALDAPAFTRLLGPLREIMERRAGESYLM
ncbi:camp-dependent protein kinase regulatory subunit [Gymnopus androsaceus JB14]|uniref:cAMP-dependent protein kinase regulatory subunit n=1 Tax=Gymnopus androsaceus JB14 TaxID=1447944 RepID=A0A6A4IPV9_9AGAR|nr:camp-dependent protein kinase regulatory subunit [Gymnopus androsaceus JB14]